MDKVIFLKKSLPFRLVSWIAFLGKPISKDLEKKNPTFSVLLGLDVLYRIFLRAPIKANYFPVSEVKESLKPQLPCSLQSLLSRHGMCTNRLTSSQRNATLHLYCTFIHAVCFHFYSNDSELRVKFFSTHPPKICAKYSIKSPSMGFFSCHIQC